MYTMSKGLGTDVTPKVAAPVSPPAASGLEPDETLEQAEAEIGFVDPKVADEGVPGE